MVTSEGLILIDSLFDPYIETGVEHIRELGFDPADVDYVLGTHGHFDHMGGHAYYQRNFGAQVGLTAADWKRAQVDKDHPVFAMEVADVDMVIEDGDTLQLGEQTITFYITPGHTEGVLSMEFTVRDGDAEYRAVIFGGGGANAGDYWRNQTMLGNIRRFQVLAAQSRPMQVRLAGHTNGPARVPLTPALSRRGERGQSRRVRFSLILPRKDRLPTRARRAPDRERGQSGAKPRFSLSQSPSRRGQRWQGDSIF